MATNNKSIFSINMKRAREQRLWSQREAAQKIGIRRSTLASYEEDRCQPSFETLQQICCAYRIKDWKAFITDACFLVEV